MFVLDALNRREALLSAGGWWDETYAGIYHILEVVDLWYMP